ncbi:predicted protein [Nematostella vectensis]|uniref:G-protein coupled receptors family 1 profile domain-containing protein n=1 Tax=Nematostella vectensis TaxID=45351 RepID=A7RXG0_NEMVE|nr:histamine H2 receptor [Nematostella vectensis]EDO43840.1 predicted protein [Nematostella vectensis]|eukprot:XP_001635903.1 predicted protein [Nematostella vectensis]
MMINTTNLSCEYSAEIEAMVLFSGVNKLTRKRVVLAQAIIHGVCCPFTVTLNFLIILVLLKIRSLRSNTNIMIGLLAVVDLLMGLIIQPSLVAENIMHYSKDQFSCSDLIYHYHSDRVLFLVLQTLTFSSLHHLTLINIERYIGIRETFRYPVIITQKRLVIAVVCAWLLAGILSFNVIFPALILPMNTSVLACVLVCVYCSFVVTRESRRHHRQIIAQHMAVGLPPNMLPRKAIWVFVFLTVVILISYILAGLTRCLADEATSILTLPSSLVVLNALFNPIIFISRSKEFRIELRGVLGIRPGAER